MAKGEKNVFTVSRNTVFWTQYPLFHTFGITFSGTNSDENVKAHEKILLEYVEANNLSVISTPKYAFYNPPWTLPPMRRNEVMIEIQE